ncbi:MAG: hypothetical protein Q4E65_04855 [Clostridia bacterium]|nr:hypothetical protein [Clostridia bacterium]
MTYADSLPAMIGALSASIAEGCTDEELAILAAAFTQLGDSLALILAARPGDTD